MERLMICENHSGTRIAAEDAIIQGFAERNSQGSPQGSGAALFKKSLQKLEIP